MTGKKRIADAFARCQAASRAALIPYMTTGYPDPSLTVPLMHAIVEAGADIIELGVPFSDPMADGAVIQAAGDHALSRGMSLSKVLDFVAEFRQTNQITPVVLMGYANPVEAMGADVFIQRAAEAGVDGVLVVDYPPEECQEFQQQLDRVGLAQIFLLSPTSSDERMANVAKMAQGYVYYVSLKGVTGAGNLDVSEVAQRVNRIREFVSIPVGVGFGIRDAQSAQAIAKTADAVVIGTRFIQVLQEAVLNKPESEWRDVALNSAKAWTQEISRALIK